MALDQAIRIELNKLKGKSIKAVIGMISYHLGLEDELVLDSIQMSREELFNIHMAEDPSPLREGLEESFRSLFLERAPQFKEEITDLFASAQKPTPPPESPQPDRDKLAFVAKLIENKGNLTSAFFQLIDFIGVSQARIAAELKISETAVYLWKAKSVPEIWRFRLAHHFVEREGFPRIETYNLFGFENLSIQPPEELLTLTPELAAKHLFAKGLLEINATPEQTLREFRNYLGLSQKQMGEEVGCDRFTFIRWENEKFPEAKRGQVAAHFISHDFPEDIINRLFRVGLEESAETAAPAETAGSETEPREGEKTPEEKRRFIIDLIDTEKNLGKAFNKLRKFVELSRAQIASAFNLSVFTIDKWGQKELSKEWRLRVALYFIGKGFPKEETYQLFGFRLVKEVDIPFEPEPNSTAARLEEQQKKHNFAVALLEINASPGKTLQELYHYVGFSREQIAEEFRVHTATIRNWIDERFPREQRGNVSHYFTRSGFPEKIMRQLFQTEPHHGTATIASAETAAPTETPGSETEPTEGEKTPEEKRDFVAKLIKDKTELTSAFFQLIDFIGVSQARIAAELKISGSALPRWKAEGVPDIWRLRIAHYFIERQGFPRTHTYNLFGFENLSIQPEEEVSTLSPELAAKHLFAKGLLEINATPEQTLRELRNYLELSQKQMSSGIGFSPNAFKRWENEELPEDRREQVATHFIARGFPVEITYRLFRVGLEERVEEPPIEKIAVPVTISAVQPPTETALAVPLVSSSEPESPALAETLFGGGIPAWLAIQTNSPKVLSTILDLFIFQNHFWESLKKSPQEFGVRLIQCAIQANIDLGTTSFKEITDGLRAKLAADTTGKKELVPHFSSDISVADFIQLRTSLENPLMREIANAMKLGGSTPLFSVVGVVLYSMFGSFRSSWTLSEGFLIFSFLVAGGLIILYSILMLLHRLKAKEDGKMDPHFPRLNLTQWRVVPPSQRSPWPQAGDLVQYSLPDLEDADSRVQKNAEIKKNLVKQLRTISQQVEAIQKGELAWFILMTDRKDRDGVASYRLLMNLMDKYEIPTNNYALLNDDIITIESRDKANPVATARQFKKKVFAYPCITEARLENWEIEGPPAGQFPSIVIQILNLATGGMVQWEPVESKFKAVLHFLLAA